MSRPDVCETCGGAGLKSVPCSDPDHPGCRIYSSATPCPDCDNGIKRDAKKRAARGGK